MGYILVSFGLIFCGIGLLKFNNYARIATLWLIWFAGLIAFYVCFGMATEYDTNIFYIFDAIFSWLLTLGWLIILITWFLIRPNIKKLFHRTVPSTEGTG